MTTQVTTSQRFCNAQADVIFQSSDRVNFRIHKKNLETSADGFPSPEFSTQGEIIPLTETAATLELLFRFVYPLKLPDLENYNFEALLSLAEAAEKYRVYAAMALCKILLSIYTYSHPTQLLPYAVKHGYNALADNAAPLLICKPLQFILTVLPPSAGNSWARYYGAWLDARTNLFRVADAKKCCPNLHQQMSPLLLAFGKDLATLQSVESVFALRPPKPVCQNSGYRIQPSVVCCTEQLDLWKTSIKNDVLRIPKFSSFL